jgi:hypothetical protein
MKNYVDNSEGLSESDTYLFDLELISWADYTMPIAFHVTILTWITERNKFKHYVTRYVKLCEGTKHHTVKHCLKK